MMKLDLVHYSYQGEYFLSGANPEAYEAYLDMSVEYFIVQPTREARLEQVYAEGRTPDEYRQYLRDWWKNRDRQ